MNHLEDEGSLFALIRESLTNHLQPTVISVHASIGHYIAHVDNYYQQGKFVEAEEIGDVVPPEALQSPEAQKMLEKLIEAGMLGNDYQPTGISLAEQALLAKVVAEHLKIKDVWQVFGSLWNINPESLRAHFNRALDQRKSLDFQDKLKNILD